MRTTTEIYKWISKHCITFSDQRYIQGWLKNEGIDIYLSSWVEEEKGTTYPIDFINWFNNNEMEEKKEFTVNINTKELEDVFNRIINGFEFRTWCIEQAAQVCTSGDELINTAEDIKEWVNACTDGIN